MAENPVQVGTCTSNGCGGPLYSWTGIQEFDALKDDLSEETWAFVSMLVLYWYCGLCGHKCLPPGT